MYSGNLTTYSGRLATYTGSLATYTGSLATYTGSLATYTGFSPFPNLSYTRPASHDTFSGTAG